MIILRELPKEKPEYLTGETDDLSIRGIRSLTNEGYNNCIDQIKAESVVVSEEKITDIIIKIRRSEARLGIPAKEVATAICTAINEGKCWKECK